LGLIALFFGNLGEHVCFSAIGLTVFPVVVNHYFSHNLNTLNVSIMALMLERIFVYQDVIDFIA